MSVFECVNKGAAITVLFSAYLSPLWLNILPLVCPSLYLSSYLFCLITIFCFCQPWPSRILSTLSSHFLSPQKASNKAKSCCSTLPPCSHYPPPPVTQHLISLSSFPSIPTLSPLLLLAVICYPLKNFFPPKKSLLKLPRKENPYFDNI